MKYGTPTEEQLTKINKLSKRTLSADEVFAFSGQSAGDLMIPGRYMRLSPEILKIMADDAKKGVSFMLNHSWASWGGAKGIPYGKVFDGKIESSKNNGESVALLLDKYIVRDSEVTDGVSADALIKKIETGILSDTSIGWGTNIMTCSICGMNYYSRDCNHWKGQTYELSDGTKKVCTITAMPPSVIIPYNNNALFEESIVWDGAYPGAMVTQSKHGDIIETPNGNFTIIQDKEEIPEGTLFHGYYHNGDIITMVKKSDHKKIYTIGDEKPKGSEKMSENLKKMLEAFGVGMEEVNGIDLAIVEKLAEKWEATVQTIKDSVEPLKEGEGIEPSAEYLGIPLKEIKEKLGQEVEGEELLKFAKEGIEYHKQVVEDSIAMGVKAMANDFPTDTWKTTFSTMGTVAIKEIAKTWELQAKDGIKAGRLSEPKGDEENKVTFPDEAFAVGR